MIDNSFAGICAFCVQWGKAFPIEEKTGILFIGKAVNGWINEETNIEVLFGDSKDRIFARRDQMEWVQNLEGSRNSYNTKKSAFWRTVKQVSLCYYPTNWYSNVAWSNLCKLAPYTGGNPSNRLYYEQLDACQKILAKEIEVLSPKVVVMLTSGWEKDFLYNLNDNVHPQSETTVDWDGNQTKLYQIKGTLFIASPHPQGKPEEKHVETIMKLIGNMNR